MPCRPREKCINLPGTFRCQPLRRNPRMRDDPRRRGGIQSATHPAERRQHDAPRVENPCGMGFHLVSDQCVGMFSDIDECLTTPCSNPFTMCLNIPGSYSCVCHVGFYYSQLAEECLGFLNVVCACSLILRVV